MPMPLSERIQELIALQLGRPQVGPRDRLIEDLGAESMDIVNIIAALEECFEIEISETVLSRVRTVEDLRETVRQHLDTRWRP
jgi:acyl carrier protein